MKLALIGCGAIGRVIAKAVKDGEVDAALECLYDKDHAKSEALTSFLEPRPSICRDIKEILASEAELVIEAASQKAVKEYASSILQAGKSLLIMSVGALLDAEFYDELKSLAQDNGVKIYLPSGAVGGLDALKAASLGKISEVKLVTTKHPKALAGAPFLRRKEIKPESIRKKMVLYEGDALEAVKEFPANINVAAVLSLAGIGAGKTRVTMVADPLAKGNLHEITARGDFGSLNMRFENLPSPENPQTSYLAALSAIATLKKIPSPIEIGT